MYYFTEKKKTRVKHILLSKNPNHEQLVSYMCDR